MFKNQLFPIIYTLGVSFIVLFLIRLTLLFFYPQDFMDLDLKDLLLSLFMGFRVDMITLFTFSFLFVLLLLMIKSLPIKKTLALLWSGVLNIIFIISLSDVLYFNYSHKHLSNEVFNLGNDLDIVFGMAFGSMLVYTIFAFLFSIIFSFFVYKLFSKPYKKPLEGKNFFISFFIVVLILFLGIRNSLHGKSFGISDAYAVAKVSSGNLALNGFFTIYRGAKQNIKHNLIPLNDAIIQTKKLLYTPNAPFCDKEYPLLREYQEKKKPKYNVVIVLLESFGAEHLDGFTHYKELGITPYFKKLSEEGLKFTNFYANGYRSIFGITSLFTGLTIPAGANYLGKGLELSKLSYLGNIAKQNGYSTLAMQASHRRSYRVDSVAHLAGFDQYYGSEDMPNVEKVDKGRKPETGTYDFNMFDFYHKKLNTLKEPFLGFTFTVSTHPDYYLPSKKFERFPHDLKNYNGRMNAYGYTDDALRRFMEAVKKEPWFDRTIFIFTADHGSGDALDSVARKYRPYDKPLASIEHYRIPLIIYAPKIFKPQTITTLGSHNDLFATIVDMLGWKAKITTFGNSLFDDNVSKRFVYFYGGNIIGLIENSGYIKYNFKEIVETNSSNAVLLRKDLFAIDTAESQLIEKNKITK